MHPRCSPVASDKLLLQALQTAERVKREALTELGAILIVVGDQQLLASLSTDGLQCHPGAADDFGILKSQGCLEAIIGV